MTNPPPVDRRSSRSRDLGFDEAIAMLIAFGTVGAILWWGLSQKEADLQAGQPRPTLGANPLPTDLLLKGSPVPEGSANQAGIALSARDQAIRDQAIRDQAIRDQQGRSPQATVTSPGIPPAVVPAIVAPAVLPGVVSPAAVSPTAIASPTSPLSVAPPPMLVVPAARATPVEFSDVPATYWAHPFIAALAQRGIINGFSDGTFKPDEPVSRSQYAAMIETIFKSAAVQNPIAFKDIPGNFWATRAIDTAVKTGFLKGYPDGTFQPGQPISRVQVLASLVNGLNVSQPPAPADVVKRYQDSAQIPAWAVPVAASATESGMVVNYPTLDTLNPNQPITRAEISAIMHQALVAAGKLDPISSDYIVRP